MNIYEGLITFTVVWWLILFMVLPLGAQPVDSPEPGHADSAPAKPRMLMKFVVTTAVALVITFAIYGVIQSGWINLRPPPTMG